MTALDRKDRFKGCLLGLAVGDAVGAAVEFEAPGTFEPVTHMAGGGPHGLEPGQWTDDTSMALCLSESLLECGGFDPTDQMTRYVRWWRDGHMSVKGYCFDIGMTIGHALQTFERTGEPFSGSTDPYAAGNGSIMRLAPVPMFYASNAEEAIEYSAASSRTTHGADEAVDACRYLAAILVDLLNGAPKSEALRSRPNLSLAPKIGEIEAGSYRHREPPEIEGSGYVVRSLEAALWAFNKGNDFRQGCLLAVNLGDDADTTGAVFGQLAGACYGTSGIPEEWLGELAWREGIDGMAVGLAEVGEGRG